jgi:hypothetical protein
LSASIQASISSQFNGTLRTGDGKDSPLASTIKSLLANGDVWPARIRYAAVHLVRQETSSIRDRWMLATRRAGQIVLSADKRILGEREIAFAFVHVDVPAGGVPADVLKSDHADLEIRAIVKTKLPANFEHLIALLKVGAARNSKGREARTAGLLGYGVLSGIAVPSDVTAFEAGADKLEAVGQAVTFDNEGKYFWDVTVGMPVNKLSLLEYSNEGGMFLPKVVNKQSVYGMLDIYPNPVDIKSGKARWLMPRAAVGVGLTGRPGDNFFLGSAWGLPQLQFFVGSGFAVHRQPKAGTDSSGKNFTQRYSSRLTYGINIPVLSTLKKVSR